DIAAGLVGSFTRDAGQYCTKPGVVLAPAASEFVEAVRTELEGVTAGRLLTDGMQRAFAEISGELVAHPAVEVLSGADSTTLVTVISVPAEAVLAEPGLFLRECFGPLSLIVRYRDEVQLNLVLDLFEGSLTGTVHCQAGEDVRALTNRLAALAGRVLFNGWPTGVAIAWGQHHGGPWPATTAAIHSSVGATAIRRWLTPVSYQDAPQSVLPVELRDETIGVPRRIDGELVR
ncbi:MAG: aldehyde dehydrogenase (NADP(+)), partial [Agromyces sp.]